MLCPNCESENRDGAKFCDECGFPLAGISATTAHESGGFEEGDARFEAESGVEELEERTSSEELENESESDCLPLEEDDYPAEEICEDGGEAREAELSDLEAGVTAVLPSEELGLDEGGTDGQPSDPAATAVVDLSGFDRSLDYGESIIDPSYEPPEVSWRDGGTIKMQRVEGEAAPRSKDYLASSTKERSNKKKIAAIAAICIVLAVGAIVFATYQMQLWGGKAVPDVVGMTEADARSVLEERGFAVRTTQVKSDETEGLVLVMDPTAGSRADEGAEVIVHLATARTVPDIIGLPEQEALKALNADGFENVKFEKQRSDAEEGTVLSVIPEKGTRARSSQEVIATVAQPFIVPDVRNMYLADAQKAVADAGLGSDYVLVNTQDYTDGLIIGTQPAAGEKVTSDTIVHIQVAHARGKELEDLTANYLAPGSVVTIGMYSYEIQSLNSVEYIGNDSVAFNVTARPFTSILGETVYISARAVTGTVTWTADNQIASIS